MNDLIGMDTSYIFSTLLGAFIAFMTQYLYRLLEEKKEKKESREVCIFLLYRKVNDIYNKIENNKLKKRIRLEEWKELKLDFAKVVNEKKEWDIFFSFFDKCYKYNKANNATARKRYKEKIQLTANTIIINKEYQRISEIRVKRNKPIYRKMKDFIKEFFQKYNHF